MWLLLYDACFRSVISMNLIRVTSDLFVTLAITGNIIEFVWKFGTPCIVLLVTSSTMHGVPKTFIYYPEILKNAGGLKNKLHTIICSHTTISNVLMMKHVFFCHSEAFASKLLECFLSTECMLLWLERSNIQPQTNLCYLTYNEILDFQSTHNMVG